MTGRLHVVPADQTVHPLEHLWSNATCRVLRAGSFLWGGDWHLHDWVDSNHILFVVRHGRLKISVAGSEYLAEEGNVVLAPPHVIRRAEAASPADDPALVHVIHFVAQLHGTRESSELLGLPAAFAPGNDRWPVIAHAAEQLIDYAGSNRPGGALAANGECLIMLALLWQDVADGAAQPDRHTMNHLRVMEQLAPAFSVIRAHYSNDLSITDLAGTVGLHPTYFSHLFKMVTGMPPARYVSRYRLSRARDLLISTTMTLDTIAHRTGFANASYFARAFHRVEGISPGECRRRSHDSAE